LENGTHWDWNSMLGFLKQDAKLFTQLVGGGERFFELGPTATPSNICGWVATAANSRTFSWPTARVRAGSHGPETHGPQSQENNQERLKERIEKLFKTLPVYPR
jgi:hypothetical protein